jgi:hypothetical protein
MVRLNKLFTIIAIFSAAVLSGCASVKTASSSEDAKAKTFATNPNQAKLYIYRNEFMGAALRMGVELNGKEIGKTGPKSYFAVDVPPGKHSIVSRAENDASLEVMTEAGKNYFIWQEVKMGFLLARSKLQLVDEAQGQAGVRESQLLEMSVSNPSTVNNASATPTPYASRPATASTTASASATENPSSDTVSQVKQAEQPKPVEATSNYPVKIEKVPFEIGVSSATVERIAKQNSCESTKGAGLLYKKGPVEVYRVDCKDGREIKARCELRQCNIFTP